MSFVKSSKTKKNKTEGTSQTYGQLVSIPSRKDVTVTSVSNEVSATVSPQDSIVKIISNEKSEDATGTLELNDIDRSKIAIAAHSDTKDPAVSINKIERLKDSSLEGSSLNNFSKNVANIDLVAIVLGSSLKSKEEVKKVLTEAQKVDLMISLKSKESEEIEFNSLKEVQPDLEFTYNFFTQDESDVSTQEDQSQDPLLKNDIYNVPRYVELSWTPVGVTEEMSSDEIDDSTDTSEVRKLRRETFSKKKGVSGFNSTNFKNSYEKSKKRANPRKKDGVDVEIVDMHQLDVAMDSTSNKNVFSNSVTAVFSTEDQNDVIDTLPVLPHRGRNKK